MNRMLRILPAAFVIATGCGEGGPEDENTPVPAATGAPGSGGTDVQAFTNARVFDGTGAPIVESGVVLVRDGVIAEVGPAADVVVPDGADVTDLAGRWLVPGFINAHGHVDRTGDRSSVLDQLEVYAHYGVTTVLSLGENDDDALRLKADRWSPALSHARIFAAGPVLVSASPEEARSDVARAAEAGVDWVKIRVDDNLGRGTKMSPEVYGAVIDAAREADLPVAIHIVDLEDAKGVVRAGGALVAHSVRDRPVDQELIDLMLERDVCLVPTFTRELSTFAYAQRPDFFDDPFFLDRAAPPDPDAFLTPQRQAQAEGEGPRFWREALPLAMENMRRLHEAGVGIAMGTDTGPTGRFQGYFEQLEMEMMVEAGLTPSDVLVAATAQAAQCTGLDGRLGTIATGASADFVALDADPLEDITNAREIHGVWVAGNRVR